MTTPQFELQREKDRVDKAEKQLQSAKRLLKQIGDELYGTRTTGLAYHKVMQIVNKINLLINHDSVEN